MMVDFLALIMIIWLLSEKGGELHVDILTFLICLIYIIGICVVKPLIENNNKDKK